MANENAQLRTQYEALVKEINEKSQLMDEQIAQKELQQATIEEDMTKKIVQQEEEIRKQVVIYGEQTKVKEGEEKELQRVLTDYKKKHDEFSRAMKKSRETFKVYEGEVKNMNQRMQDLQQLKKKLLEGGVPGEKKKGRKPAPSIDVSVKEGEIVKLQSEWNSEKEALLKEKEELMAASKDLQEQIKVLKEKNK